MSDTTSPDLETLARDLTSLCAYPLPASVIDTIKQSVAVLRTVQRASVPPERSALREQVEQALGKLPAECRCGNLDPELVLSAVLALLPPTPGDAPTGTPTCATCRHWELISGQAGRCAFGIRGANEAIGATFCCNLHQPQPAQPSQPERT